MNRFQLFIVSITVILSGLLFVMPEGVFAANESQPKADDKPKSNEVSKVVDPDGIEGDMVVCKNSSGELTAKPKQTPIEHIFGGDPSTYVEWKQYTTDEAPALVKSGTGETFTPDTSTIGKFTIKCWGLNGDENDVNKHISMTYIVVEVKDVSVGSGDDKVTSTTETPGDDETFYTCKNSLLTFKATPSHGDEWPKDMPTWVGAIKSTTTAGEAYLNTDTLTTDETTVTVKCGESEKAIKIKTFEPEIKKVPDYIYSNATAAVPVKFKITDFELDDIDSLKLDFYAGGDKKIDGIEQVSFTEYDEDDEMFITWVNISNFQFDVDGDTVDNSYFIIKVKHVNGDEYCESKKKNIKIYGDTSVNIFEIGVNLGFQNMQTTGFSFDKLTETAVQSYRHVGGFLHSVDNGTSTFPHEAGASLGTFGTPTICGAPEFLSAFGNNGFNVHTSSRSITNTEIKLKVKLGDDNSGQWTGGGEVVTNELLNECIGYYAACSYPHKTISFHDGIGMKIEKETSVIDLTSLTGTTVTTTLTAVDDGGIGTTEADNFLNVVGVTLSILGSAAAPGLSEVNSLVSGLYNYVKSNMPKPSPLAGTGSSDLMHLWAIAIDPNEEGETQLFNVSKKVRHTEQGTTTADSDSTFGYVNAKPMKVGMTLYFKLNASVMITDESVNDCFAFCDDDTSVELEQKITASGGFKIKIHSVEF